jgi:hypothetical protein
MRAAGMSATGIWAARMPALLTSASIRPAWPSMVENSCSTSRSTATSARTASAVLPAAVASLTTRSAAARFSR